MSYLTDDEYPDLGKARNAPIIGNGADTFEPASNAAPPSRRPSWSPIATR